MKITLIFYIIFFSAFVMANEEEIPIKNTSELQSWCITKSKQHFLAKNITPYNWTSSRWTKGNVLNVKGQWKINNKAQIVNCRILNGAAKKYAIIEMPSQTISTVTYEKESIINKGKTLQKWCKNKSAQHFIAKDITPYNWTSSHWEKDNYLFVKGYWKANNSTHVINCRIKKGIAEKYTTIDIAKK